MRPASEAERPFDRAEAARLIAAIAEAGDRQAFARLFAFYAPRLKTFLARQGFGASDCDDLIQDTMLAVWRKAGQFDAEAGAVSTWIFTICRNLGIDRRRRLARSFANAEPVVDIDPSPSAEGEIISREEETRVRRALDRLPAEQAEVIALSFFSQSPQSEIAKALGIPLGTVKSRVRLAMNRLRHLLDEPS
ncbi:RNA polymerase subunit sigma [Pleomorphomonas diazotrophica]|uniref:RNA polymerase subunit sigma n=1 Tax=Pleomorphomonas diazotrophica TaxID=1166257 RepID=A0A1I4UUM8_9HYPH|nr:sigma-70 family RNA polymerase sigma factor [Pleomorphomonas diazotrophica]PKR89824.1 RNA polymerase subunit sigma [Pleomorphomonas diazotrophica]SFM92453.1 RNA polymerase sigma-70 factor, ECF subfamily [Pleomorphomonas diazotrophica]